MPISKLKIRKQPNVNLYKVYDEGRPLSKKGIPKAMAEKQKTAVILSELRKAGKIPKRK
jgi:hypothetical protein